MKTTLTARLTALLVAVTFTGNALGQTAATAPADEEEVKPKFIWGLLLNVALKYALSAFGEYLIGKLTQQLTPESFVNMLFNSKSASIVPLAGATPAGLDARSIGAPENAVAGEPGAPLKVENGKENYQAVHVALLDFDRKGTPLGFHPVSEGFKTGARFKLRVLPTFDGLLAIDNINPKQERKQIYPPQADQVVKVKAGMEILIPLDKDQYFEFGGATGDEQLVITLRDPRAFGSAASSKPVTRKDEHNGSNFMQELQPGAYPVIAQALKIRHDASPAH